jgi:hypothetical protein
VTASTTGAVVTLPLAGQLRRYELREPGSWQRPTRPITSRVAYAAAHVIPNSLADNVPGAPASLDWDATMAYRHELWSYGLGVADAMDTAQRGMGLDWPATRDLIHHSGREAASVGGRLACGASTDQLDIAAVPTGARGLAAITDAYREQIEVVRTADAQVVLMASRALAHVADSAADYLSVYGPLLAEADRPVILHWLGEMFDPALRGYWGATETAAATTTFLQLIEANANKVDGVKVSLLDAAHEVALRRALPPGVRLYTGDDFNYPELIIGDEQGHSDALLGVFAAIYPAASTALQQLDAGNTAQAREILDSTRALGRHIFAAPTYYYKTGIAFLAWLNGHQDGFVMVGGLQSARSVLHLARVFELANEAQLLTDPDRAAHRLGLLLATAGVAR